MRGKETEFFNTGTITLPMKTAIYRPDCGTWGIKNSVSGYTAYSFK